MGSNGERPSALKHGLSKDVVSTSPLQAPGLKAAKTKDSSEAHVSLPAGVPALPGSVSTVPVSPGGVAEQGGPGSSGGGGSGGVPGVGGGAFGGSLSLPVPLAGGPAGLTACVSGVGGDLQTGGAGSARQAGGGGEAAVMQTLLDKMNSLDTKFDSNLQSLQQQAAINHQTLQKQLSDQASSFKAELATLRADMVSRSDFSVLEGKVQELQVGGLPSPQLAWFQEQINRNDPANRCLCFAGFKDSTVESRATSIETFMQNAGVDAKIQSFDHIWSGPQGNRSLTPLCIVELSSRQVREQTLKKLQANSTMKDSGDNKISVARAKTASQMKRNSSLKKACDLLKKDGRTNGLTVEIKWLIELPDGTKSKDRAVTVGDEVAFLQIPSDLTGSFQKSFCNLTV